MFFKFQKCFTIFKKLFLTKTEMQILTETQIPRDLTLRHKGSITSTRGSKDATSSSLLFVHFVIFHFFSVGWTDRPTDRHFDFIFELSLDFFVVHAKFQLHRNIRNDMCSFGDA